MLGGTIATGLAAAGARVAVLGRRHDLAAAKADELRSAGGDAMPSSPTCSSATRFAWRATRCSARGDGSTSSSTRPAATSRARATIHAASSRCRSTRSTKCLRLNLHGTVIPSLVVGEAMARVGRGSIINISSMAAISAISGTLGYSVAKSGVDSFTRWLAMDLARKHGDGDSRERGRARFLCVGAKPRRAGGRRGPADAAVPAPSSNARRWAASAGPMNLVGAVQWLASDAASFVTGVVIPVDGGFSSFSGV